MAHRTALTRLVPSKCRLHRFVTSLVCGTDLHPPNHVTHVAQVVATVLVVIVEFWDFLRDAVTREGHWRIPVGSFV